jgi:hypothetical protein
MKTLLSIFGLTLGLVFIGPAFAGDVKAARPSPIAGWLMGTGIK